MSEQVVMLGGLNGANPLGFLAGLGCLRMAARRETSVRLAWKLAGQWRPILHGFDSEARLLDVLEAASSEITAGPDLSESLGNNITVSTGSFRLFAVQAAECPEWSPFAAAFGCDAIEDERNKRLQYTKLCFITGSGHQNFLETIRQLRARVTREHLRRALFESMDPIDKGLSFRWDPADAREYALQWNNPGPEGVQACWGAGRLAIEALPFFPALPRRGVLETTAFVTKDEFRWPIWSDPLSVGAIRSLLSNADILAGRNRRALRSRGIEELFASRRVRIGEGANFKVSFRPARPAMPTKNEP